MKADIVRMPHRLVSFLCLGITILAQSTYGNELPVVWSLSNVFIDGENVTLKCSLMGTAAVTFKWTYEHKITNVHRSQAEEDMGGMVEYSDYLSFFARRMDNNKKFSCTSTSGGATLDSAPYTIFVFTSPFVPHIYGPTAVKEHSGRHTWTCDVQGATLMAPKVTWKNMGRELSEILDIRVNTTSVDNMMEFKVQLNLTTTLPEDVYSYILECEFQTDFAKFFITRSQVHSVVILWTKPRTYPSSKDLALYRVKDMAFLNCTMRANSIDTIRWNKDYLTLSKTTSMRGNYHQEGAQMWWAVLTFRITTLDNDRNYTCEVMGADGTMMVASDPVTVYVYQPPHIVSIEVAEVIKYKDESVVECVVQNASFVLPTITWVDEHNTIYQGDVKVETHPSIYENNLLVYEVKNRMNLTLPKVHKKEFTCLISHGYGHMTYTESKTGTTKLIWDTPVVLPSTGMPYYAVLNTEMGINCSMSAQGKFEITLIKEYEVAGTHVQSNSEGLDTNFVQLHWKYTNFSASLLDNARFFACSVEIEGQKAISESLILFVIQPQGEVVMHGPNKLARGIKGIWTCKVQAASIGIPSITWLFNDDEVIDGVETSVYTSEVPHYNYVHDVTSNVTHAFYTDVIVEVKCISTHKVADYFDRLEAVQNLLVGTPEVVGDRRASLRSTSAFKVLKQDPFMVGMNILVYLVIVHQTGMSAVKHLSQN